MSLPPGRGLDFVHFTPVNADAARLRRCSRTPRAYLQTLTGVTGT